MQIVDFQCFGNTVRFYLGEDSLDQWWGDDWGDVPYECNAELVYPEYVAGYKDLTFDADYIVLEPCSGVHNSSWSKKDMIERRVPCVAVKRLPAPQTAAEALYQRTWDCEHFDRLIADDDTQLFYFGDEMDPDVIFTDEGATPNTSDAEARGDDSIVKFDGQCLLELYSDERASTFLIMVDEYTFELLTSLPQKTLLSFAPSSSADGEWVRDEEFIGVTLDHIRAYAEADAPEGTEIYVRLVSPIILDV